MVQGNLRLYFYVCGAVMEIIIFIIIAVIFYIFILPFINTFGSNSEHKNSGKLKKTNEAFKQVSNNYKETKKVVSEGFIALEKGVDALEKGVDALEKESRTWPDKAKKYRLEESEKSYQRTKNKVDEINRTRKKAGLEEISLIDFFEYNKEHQERARQELEAEKNEARLKVIEEDESTKRKEQVSKILVEHKESLAKEEQLRKEKLEAEKLKEEQLKTNPTIEIKLDQLETALVEFIYIRYYLTGLKALPPLKCIYDSWAKTPYAKTELNEAQWQKIIEKMSFNPIKRKKIDALYHFTHKDNLPSILSKGLLTKKTLEDQNIEYKYNDEKRLEGVKHSLSLSFSHPNWKMFGKYRNLLGQNDFVVLKISPELLSGNSELDHKHLDDFDYLDKAIFCKKNAANQIESKKSISERKSHKVFLDIFESTIDIELLTYPYLNESEILYQGNIPKEFIQEINVFEEDTNLHWVQDLGFKLSVNKTMFEKR